MKVMTDTGAAWPARLTVVLAALVAAGALTAAWWQRPDVQQDSAAERSAAPTTAAGEPRCGNSPCEVLDSTTVNGYPVQLLAGSGGRVGKLRIDGPRGERVLDVSITGLGASLTGNSLQCAAGTTPACLVVGPQRSGAVGQVFLARAQSWNSPTRPYFSNAGTIVLDNVVGNDSPEVVVVEHDCGPDTELAACRDVPVVAAVHDLGGEVIGCSETYPWPARIPGWPEIDLDGAGLRPCG